MMGLRMPELLLIGFIVLLVFGPGKLAGLGRGLGQGIRGFKNALTGGDEKPEGGGSASLPPTGQADGRPRAS